MAIRDELKEIIFLKQPSVIISEWIPFGNNQIAALNYKLGALERLKSTLLTTLVDEFPEQSIFESDPVHSRVVVNDFDLTRFVEFTAQVDIPEAEGIAQEEEFAVHVSEQGLVVFALDLVEVNGTANQVSLDMLTRVNVDLIMDSSNILDTLLTHNQIRILDVMYRGKSHNRGKFVMALGEEITPHLNRALDYRDGEDYQNELEQVIGTLEEAETLQDGSFIFFGTLGSIFITKNLEIYEDFVGLYALVRALDIFMDEYFARLWLGWDESLRIRGWILEESERDPNIVTRAKEALSQVGADGVILEALMQYLTETISFTKNQLSQIIKNTSPAQREFAEKVKIKRFFDRVESRIDDAEKVVEGLKREVAGLQSVVATLSDKQMKRVYDAIQDSTRSTEELLVASERSSHALTIIEVVVAGTLALAFFEILGVIDLFQTLFVSAHAIVFLLAIGSWGLMAGLLFGVMQYLTKRSEPHLAMNIRFDQPITVSQLESYLEGKPVTSRISKHDGISEVLKVTWSESDKQRWLGEEPTLSITYDAKNSYLLSIAAEFDNPNIDRDKMRKIMQTEVEEFFRQDKRNHSCT
jgi:hypothetical protein